MSQKIKVLVKVHRNDYFINQIWTSISKTSFFLVPIKSMASFWKTEKIFIPIYVSETLKIRFCIRKAPSKFTGRQGSSVTPRAATHVLPRYMKHTHKIAQFHFFFFFFFFLKSQQQQKQKQQQTLDVRWELSEVRARQRPSANWTELRGRRHATRHR